MDVSDIIFYSCSCITFSHRKLEINAELPNEPFDFYGAHGDVIYIGKEEEVSVTVIDTS